jgi:hypothetical protein
MAATSISGPTGVAGIGRPGRREKGAAGNAGSDAEIQPMILQPRGGNSRILEIESPLAAAEDLM